MTHILNCNMELRLNNIVVKANGKQAPRRHQSLPTRESLAPGSWQTYHSRAQHFRANSTPEEGGDEHAELLPEEDWTAQDFAILQVPGGYQDTLSKNTKLGKAVDEACSELEHLGKLEKESLEKATELLRKLGYKGDLCEPSTSSTSPDNI